MQHLIQFYRRKLDITTLKGNIAYYYGDLIYVKYEGSCSWLYFSDGKSYSVNVPLKYLMENIPEKPFFRANRTEIINLSYYKEYEEYPSTVVLENRMSIKLSARNITPFKKKKAGLQRISPLCSECFVCPLNEKCSDFLMFCLPQNPISEEKDG